jgi:hypothetical protein
MKRAYVLTEAHNHAWMNMVLNFHLVHVFSLGGAEADKKVM